MMAQLPEDAPGRRKATGGAPVGGARYRLWFWGCRIGAAGMAAALCRPLPAPAQGILAGLMWVLVYAWSSSHRDQIERIDALRREHHRMQDMFVEQCERTWKLKTALRILREAYDHSGQSAHNPGGDEKRADGRTVGNHARRGPDGRWR